MRATAILLFAAAAALLAVSAAQFCQKGFLFNNAWLYASQEERERMDKAPYYRQSAVVFLLLGLIFALLGLYALTRSRALLILEGLLALGTVLYAVVSSARIEKTKKER